MSITIDFLKQEQENEYENLICAKPTGLLYYSLQYRNFLSKFMKDSDPYYLVAFNDGQMIGALPTFLKRNAKYGNVLNSLPFYGSNGGIITSPLVKDPKEVSLALLQAFYDLAHQKNVCTATIISNPLENNQQFYEKYALHTLRDERIGQISPLPVVQCEDEIADVLMNQFHRKTRNMVRKALKSNFIVSHGGSMKNIECLYYLHCENIQALGGLAKPRYVFDAIQSTFVYDKEYRIYTAESDGLIIAALLVFFYNKTAEYFTPAVAEQYRSNQPVSLLIFEAMKEAVHRGFKYWNWGGTWLSQSGVYAFKKRWGTVDYPYYYYIHEFNQSLRGTTPAILLSEYPFYYVLPFNQLKKSHNDL